MHSGSGDLDGIPASVEAMLDDAKKRYAETG